MSSIFKIPLLDPESPDLWVDNVRDSLSTSGMAAIFTAADCRNKADVPVQIRSEVDRTEPWKMACAWTHIRRSLNSVPNIYARSGRCKFPDVESLIRTVLYAVQKRSQGVEARLRDEMSAANLADYPSLAAYIGDLEAKFSKLAAHGVKMTDSEQRYFLIRGLTADYNSVRASILSYRDRYDRPADLVTV